MALGSISYATTCAHGMRGRFRNAIHANDDRFGQRSWRYNGKLYGWLAGDRRRHDVLYFGAEREQLQELSNRSRCWQSSNDNAGANLYDEQRGMRFRRRLRLDDGGGPSS